MDIKNILLARVTFIVLFLITVNYASAQLINSPTDIPNVKLWLDASDPNGNNSIPADGTAISTWKDKSGSNNDAVVLAGQGAATFRSTAALQINGKPVMEFQRINTNLGNVYKVAGLDIRPIANPDITVFVVYRQRNTAVTDNAIWGVDNGNWDRFFYLRNSNFGNTTDDGIVGLGPQDKFALVSNSATANKTHLLSVVYDGEINGGLNTGPTNASKVRFGSTIVTNFTDTTEASDQQNSLSIGWDGNDGTGDFYLAEFIVYNRLLTECETSQVVDYLSIKYGESFSQTITKQPLENKICTPNNAVFTVETVGVGLTFQWQEDTGTGVFTNISDGGIYGGTTTNTLTLTSPPLNFSGRKYRVQVTKPSGCVSISNNAGLLIGPVDPVVSTNTLQKFCDIDRATIANLNVTGTNLKWYNTPTGGTPLVATDLLTTTTYYVTQTINECESATRLPIAVTVSETVPAIIPSSILPIEECDSALSGSDTDGFTSFDLTQRETILLNGKSATDFAFLYFENASYTLPSIPNPGAFTNSIINGQTIYVRIQNKRNPACYTDNSFTIKVKALPTLITSVVSLKQCDDTTDGISLFNLTEANRLISANSATETITYYRTQAEATTGLGTNRITNYTNYPNPTALGSFVYARIENTLGCFRIAKIDLVVGVSQIPSSFNTLVYSVCDDELDGNKRNGIATFDFSDAKQTIANLFPLPHNFTISFYNNESDALAEINPIPDISNHRNLGYPNSQNIYVRLDSNLINGCLGLGHHITLNVEKLPVANPVRFARQCDDNPLDTEITAQFDTSTLETQLLAGQTNVNVTYFDQAGNPLKDRNRNAIVSPFPATFRTATQTITARVTNQLTNTKNNIPCSEETTISFVVDASPTVNPVFIAPVCDDGIDDSDGLHEFDTTTIETTLLGGQTGMKVHYYNGLGVELPSPLPNPFNSKTQTIRVEVINPINPTCKATTTINLVVNPLPLFSVDSPKIVCSSNPSFTVTLDPLEKNPSERFDYKWVYNGAILSVAPTLTVSNPGTYFITLTKTDGTNCSKTKEIVVSSSEKAIINLKDITIVDDSDNNTITINNASNNLGRGDYEFALDDDFSFQNSPVFEHVPAGIHTIYVRDKKGCGVSQLEVSVIGFPKFFTPNGDGFNDTWQVKGIGNGLVKVSFIYVYDRYGKLLTKINPDANGWDGMYNGVTLPASDYWFSLQLTDQNGNIRDRKGHFSLKR